MVYLWYPWAISKSIPSINPPPQQAHFHQRTAIARTSDHEPYCLRDHGAGGPALVIPRRGKRTNGLVVPGEAVYARLDKDQAEFAIFVLAVALEVFADGDGLADEHVKVFCHIR